MNDIYIFKGYLKIIAGILLLIYIMNIYGRKQKKINRDKDREIIENSIRKSRHTRYKKWRD